VSDELLPVMDDVADDADTPTDPEPLPVDDGRGDGPVTR
jgi:hypothetical protein